MSEKSEKLEITKEMVESFSKMLTSTDKEDGKFALDILENRDKSNVESEENFKLIGDIIVNNHLLFPIGKRYVIKIQGKMLTIGKDRTIFHSISDAERTLSRHLTDFIGKSVNTVADLEFADAKIYRWSGKPDSALDNHDLQYRKLGRIPPYNPNFNKKKFLADCRKKYIEQFQPQGYINYLGTNDFYLKAVKQFFGGGKELRDFLLKNKIAEIVEL